MNVAVRAHRILNAMADYQKASPTDDRLSKLAHARLGAAIGSYRNPGPAGEGIGIFADGMAWRESDRSIEIRFADLAEVDLPHGKESDGLLLHLRDGWQQQLPVRGQRGRLRDFMEMFRFVRRVMEDLQRHAATE